MKTDGMVSDKQIRVIRSIPSPTRGDGGTQSDSVRVGSTEKPCPTPLRIAIQIPCSASCPDVGKGQLVRRPTVPRYLKTNPSYGIPSWNVTDRRETNPIPENIIRSVRAIPSGIPKRLWGAGPRWGPRRSRSADRGGSRDPAVLPLSPDRNRQPRPPCCRVLLFPLYKIRFL